MIETNTLKIFNFNINKNIIYVSALYVILRFIRLPTCVIVLNVFLIIIINILFDVIAFVLTWLPFPKYTLKR